MLYLYKKTLTKLFSDLNSLKRKPTNIKLCFSIQEQLIDRIRETEKRIRSIKNENNLINNKIKNDRLPREINNKLKELIQYNNYKKTGYDDLLSIYRDIGDGIAFIYLIRWDIKPLVLAKEMSGFISLKKGLRLELKTFRKFKSANIICIFNDITNSLRHGDLTIPLDGKPFLVELKSGRSTKSDKRAKRQKERAQNILTYLDTDTGKNIYPEQGESIMYRKEMLNKEKDHQQKFRKILSSALLNNVNITTKIEKGLYYSIIVKENELENEFKKLPKHISPITIYVNEFKHYKQGYYPFTLLINDPEALYRFYIGDYIITVFIDPDFIISELAKDGFTTKFLSEEGYFLQLTDTVKNISVKISKHFFGRIGGEFLNLKWIIKEFGAKIRHF